MFETRTILQPPIYLCLWENGIFKVNIDTGYSLLRVNTCSLRSGLINSSFFVSTTQNYFLLLFHPDVLLSLFLSVAFYLCFSVCGFVPRHADVRNYKFSNVQCFITRNAHGRRTVSRHLCNVYFNDRIVRAIEIFPTISIAVPFFISPVHQY